MYYEFNELPKAIQEELHEETKKQNPHIKNIDDYISKVPVNAFFNFLSSVKGSEYWSSVLKKPDKNKFEELLNIIEKL